MRNKEVHVVAWNDHLKWFLCLDGTWRDFDSSEDAWTFYHGVAEEAHALAGRFPGVAAEAGVARFAVNVPEGAETDGETNYLIWKTLEDGVSWHFPCLQDCIPVQPEDQPGRDMAWPVWREIQVLYPEDAEALALQHMRTLFAKPHNNLVLLRTLCVVNGVGASLEAMSSIGFCPIAFDEMEEQAVYEGHDEPRRWLLPSEPPIQELALALISLRHHGRLAPAPLRNPDQQLHHALSVLFVHPFDVKRRFEHELRSDPAGAFEKLFDQWRGYGEHRPCRSRTSYLRLAFRAAVQVYTPEKVASLPGQHETLRDDGLETLVFGCEPGEATVRAHYVAGSAFGRSGYNAHVHRFEDEPWETPGSRANRAWNRLCDPERYPDMEIRDAYWEHGGNPMLRFDILARSYEDLECQLRRFVDSRAWLGTPSTAPALMHRAHRVSERADCRTWRITTAFIQSGFLASALPTAREIDLRHSDLQRALQAPAVAATATTPPLYDRHFDRLLHSTFTAEDHEAWCRRVYAYTAAFSIEVVVGRAGEECPPPESTYEPLDPVWFAGVRGGDGEPNHRGAPRLFGSLG